MDCSICLEAITKHTGIVTLSCEHTFHFRCIDSWFTKQIWDDLDQTCPCCRSGGGELDRCEVANNENDDDDSSYEEEEEQEDDEYPLVNRILDVIDDNDIYLERNIHTGQLLLTPVEQVVMQRFRDLFGPLNDLDWEPESRQDAAARKIQAIFRGSRVRNTHEAAVNLMRLFNQAYNLNL